MHQIPITQMEILHNSSTVFPKDLPLNPYYKNLTSDIILANNSLKASEPQNIESFFQQYICEKPAENGEKTPAPDSENPSEDHKDYEYDDYDDDEDEEYNDDLDPQNANYEDNNHSSQLPASDHSSHYTPSHPFDSATSLQENMEKRLMIKNALNGSGPSQSTKVSDTLRRGNETLRRPVKMETEYYCFPNRYKNYKYVKCSLDSLKNNPESNKTIEKKRMMILRNQKKFEASMHEAKLLTNEDWVQHSIEGVQRSLYEKALKTQKNMFLSPEDKRKLIQKNLKELHNSKNQCPQGLQRWISPFMKQPRILPKITEVKEFQLQKTHGLRGFNNFYRKKEQSFNATRNQLSGTRNTLEVRGQNRLPVIPNKNPTNKHTSLDYKALFSELETLQTLSKANGNYMESIILKSPGKKNECTISIQRNDSKKIDTKAFLGYYRKLFQGKSAVLIDKMLSPFNIDLKKENFNLDFNSFLNFNRVLVNFRACSPEDEAQYLTQMLFNEKNRTEKTKIRESIDILFCDHEKNKKEFKKRVFERLNLDGVGFIDKSLLKEKISKETDIRTILLQSLRARENQ